jgi:hypothetical protein
MYRGLNGNLSFDISLIKANQIYVGDFKYELFPLPGRNRGLNGQFRYRITWGPANQVYVGEFNYELISAIKELTNISFVDCSDILKIISSVIELKECTNIE